VEVKMAHVTSADSWVRQTYLSVQVGTVQVNLTAVVVDDLAGLLYAILEHSKCGRVGDL
jgi:hypothetical protein